MSTRAEILKAIDDICVELKGSGIPHLERLMLNAERHDLRNRLAAMPEGAEVEP